MRSRSRQKVSDISKEILKFVFIRNIIEYVGDITGSSFHGLVQ